MTQSSISIDSQVKHWLGSSRDTTPMVLKKQFKSIDIVETGGWEVGWGWGGGGQDEEWKRELWLECKVTLNKAKFLNTTDNDAHIFSQPQEHANQCHIEILLQSVRMAIKIFMKIKSFEKIKIRTF